MSQHPPTAPRHAALVLAAALAACAPAGGPIPSPTPGDPLRGLDAYVERAVEEWGIAGLAIAVVERDSVVFAGGYGVRDVRTGAPVDEHTLFAIGSNTKLFTAVAAGMLVDEGKLEWDDPAAEHLPGFRLHDPYVSREITLRDLLSHRSGLGRRGDLIWYGSDRSRAEVLERVRHLEPAHGFRSEFGYQNIMFLAAGEALGRTAGTTWDRFIRRRIFQPLGMERSSTSVLPLARMDNVAQPHLSTGGELVPVPYRSLDNAAPAGSINSSAAEMARWLRLLLQDGEIDGRRMVDSATLAEILSPQTLMPLPADTLFPSTHFAAYGLGVGLRDYQGARLASHTGGIDGMLSLVALLPDHDVGVVILTNTAGRNNLYSALMYRIVDAYLGAPPRDWSGILLRRAEEQEARAAERRRSTEPHRVAGTRPSLPLPSYAGTYRDEVYGEVVVEAGGGGLVLRFGPALAADLEHWHHDTFRARWRPGGEIFGGQMPTVTFRLGARGEVEAVDVEGLEGFRRVADGEEAE